MSLSNSIWWTRKAKIQAEERLLSNAFQSQILLLWYSFSGVAASIYYLGNSSLDGAEIAWVVFSVLTLSISGFINGLSFKERAGLIKECYETLHELYMKSGEDGADIDALANEYGQILGVCENHRPIDFYKAICVEHVSSTEKADSKTGIKAGLSRRPSCYHVAYVCFWFFKRYLVLSFLYLLPVSIFFAVKV
ncbi:SLATT domain-containing protein [Alloalcanivorax xenomutans]|uniref:SLATT domain-containing protein n=1 Tax=Alloalcanivorax xenomutans TaxID=1094342 RepID=UPI0009DD0612